MWFLKDKIEIILYVFLIYALSPSWKSFHINTSESAQVCIKLVFF